MGRRRILLILVVLAVTAMASAPFAAGAGTSYVITATKMIDGYPVGAAFPKALRFLGGTSSTTQSNSACTARWANGVTIVWHRTRPYSNWAKACVKFSLARVGPGTKAAPTWHTDKGLKIGGTQAQLEKLYPAATRKPAAGYAVWTLVRRSNLSLQAWLKRGRIAFFRLAAS